MSEESLSCFLCKRTVLRKRNRVRLKNEPYYAGVYSSSQMNNGSITNLGKKQLCISVVGPCLPIHSPFWLEHGNLRVYFSFRRHDSFFKRRDKEERRKENREREQEYAKHVLASRCIRHPTGPKITYYLLKKEEN